jgi:hypothetical protein
MFASNSSRSTRPSSESTMSKALRMVAACTGDNALENVAGAL